MIIYGSVEIHVAFRDVPGGAGYIGLVYAPVDLIPAFPVCLLVNESAVSIVYRVCSINACYHRQGRIFRIRLIAFAYGFCFSYRAEDVYHDRVRGIPAHRVEFHEVRYRVVDLVVAFAYRHLLKKRPVYVVAGDRAVRARIYLRACFVKARASSFGHRLSNHAEAVDICRVCGVQADNAQEHVIRYRVVDLVVAFAYSLLVNKSTVDVVVGDRGVGAGCEAFSRHSGIGPVTFPGRHCLYHGPERVYIDGFGVVSTYDVFVVIEFRAGGGVKIAVRGAAGVKIAELRGQERILRSVEVADLCGAKRLRPY